MFGPAGVGGDKGQVDLRLHQRGEFDFGLFGRFPQTLQCLRILAEIDALLLFEFADDPLYGALVPVIATQMGVPVGGSDLNDAIADLQEGHVKRAATQVENEDGLAPFFVQTIGQRSGRRFVDDTHHFQAGNLASVLGRLALAVVKVSRYSDDSLGDRFAQIGLGIALELLQDHRRNLLR